MFREHIRQIAAITLCLGLAGLVGLADAKDEASVLVEKKAEPAIAAPQLAAPQLAAPSNELPLPPPSNSTRETSANKSDGSAKQPFLRPAKPKRVPATTALAVTEEQVPAPPVAETEEQVPAPQVAEFEVRPTPPIVYDTDRDARRMYRSGEIEMVMVTCNPADGCYYEIPLCIPACCTDEPTVSSGRGLLGRGVVEYCWPSCGFRAIVKFRQIVHCDVKVEYEGD
jgi:hypothetical protein